MKAEFKCSVKANDKRKGNEKMDKIEILKNDYFKSIAEIIKVNLKDQNISLEELQNKMPELFEQAHQQYNNSLIKLFNDVSYYNAVEDACLESF